MRDWRKSCIRTIMFAAALGGWVMNAHAEPTPAQIEARTHFEDPGINAVTFRVTDQFFPTEEVRHGRHVSRLRSRPVQMDVKVGIGAGPTTFEDALAATYTNALLVIKNGEIASETYRNGSAGSNRFMSWSIAKSVTSILVGIALDRGLIHSLEDPVEQYVPDLKGTAFEGVSIEAMLTMRDGTSYTEQSPDGKSTLIQLRRDSAYRNLHRFSDVRPLGLVKVAPPGTRFNYSTLTSTILGRVVEGASGMTLAAFTEKFLWIPAGMEADAYWMLDGDLPSGKALAGGGFNATLRDYGRIGQMMLDGGRINGRQIVSKSWVERSTRDWSEIPVLSFEPRGYAYQWWTHKNAPGRFEAIGIYGQFISIDPNTRTVIVKLSYWPQVGGRQLNTDTVSLLDAVRRKVAD